MSAFTVNGDYMDVVMVFIMGGFAILMMRYKFDRVIMLLGFLLGVRAEKNLFVALAASGPEFLLKPISIILILCIILIFISPLLKRKRGQPA
jgi:TctA family transporter